MSDALKGMVAVVCRYLLSRLGRSGDNIGVCEVMGECKDKNEMRNKYLSDSDRSAT